MRFVNAPYWILSSEGKQYETLNEDYSTDFLVIGGGLTGVTCLFLLSREGYNATLIDANRIGYGSSGRNTGKATVQHGYIYSRIEKKYGFEKAKQYYEINNKAIQFIEDMTRQYNIDCQFKRLPAYLFTRDENFVEKLKEEFAIYQKLGLDCSYEKELPVPIDVLGAIKLNNQAQFHPKRFLDALANEAVNMNGRIFENTRVVDFHPGEECVVELENGKRIRAKNVIIASHYPCYDAKAFYFARMRADRSYIVGFETDSFPEAHFINIEKPTISLRYIPEEKVLLLSGEGHKVGHNDGDHYENLKSLAKEILGLQNAKYQWSAQDYITHDYIPYAGYTSVEYKNIFIATGYRKWGLTSSISSAMVIMDLIKKQESEYEDLFSNLRVKDIISLNFLKENADMAVQLVAGKLSIGESEIPQDRGVGIVVNIEGKRCGFYRDEDDNIYLVDITCTHMGCELKWNSQEKSWDCPCHGSRFDYKGKILEGPAEYSLNSYTELKNKINPQIM